MPFVAHPPASSSLCLLCTCSDKDGVANLKGKRAFVTDSNGKTVMVIKPNLVIGKAVAHVVDGVLTPKAAGVSTEAGAKKAPAAAEAGAKKAPAVATAGRKLLVSAHTQPWHACCLASFSMQTAPED